MHVISIFTMFDKTFLLRFFSLVVCVVTVTSALDYSAAYVTPDQDPFFEPEKGWKDKNPGDILRTRSFEPKFFGTGFNVKEAYQILYRTSHNSPREPSHTVTTVLVPYNARPNTLVVLAEAQDANAPRCAPSYGYGTGSVESIGFVLDETMFLPYLKEGYIVTIPDHLGPLNAFAAGRMEGYMTLDSVRATLNYDKLNLNKNSKVAGYGYSGGALTIGWASSLKRLYAPELNVVGWAYGGTATNISSTMNFASGSAFSGFVAAGIVGILDAYPDVLEEVQQYFTNEMRELIEYARQNCLNDMLLKLAFSDIHDKKYTTLGSKTFELPIVKQVFKSLTMGTNSKEYPDAPVFMYHGKHDEIAPYHSALKTAREWCDSGAQIKFMTYEDYLMEHLITEITGSIPAFEFLRDRIEGHDLPKGCKFENEYSLIFRPDILGGNANKVINVVLGVFGNKIGPSASILASKRTINKGSATSDRSLATRRGRYHHNSMLISAAN